MRRAQRLPSRYRWLVAAVVAIPTLVAAPWGYVRLATASSIYTDVEDVDHADAALVLGARVYTDGRPSRFLRERVEVGVALYLAGKVDYLIMSGDGDDSSGFGEPTVMRQAAEEMGVPPEAILEDPLGVDTYSSCVRARDEYGASSVVVATQEFHIPRAVWLCNQAGLAAQGVHPPARPTSSTAKGNVREVAAVAKAVIDVLRGRTPAS